MSALEAGRELDALIAEKVMGWKLFEVGYFGTEDETPEQRRYAKALARQGDNAVGTYAYVGGGKVIAYDNGFCDLFCPSTDMADAWPVAVRLSKKYEVRCFLTAWDGAACAIYDPENPTPLAHVVVDPREGGMPLAICRAVLAALSPEVPHV